MMSGAWRNAARTPWEVGARPTPTSICFQQAVEWSVRIQPDLQW